MTRGVQAAAFLPSCSQPIAALEAVRDDCFEGRRRGECEMGLPGGVRSLVIGERRRTRTCSRGSLPARLEVEDAGLQRKVFLGDEISDVQI